MSIVSETIALFTLWIDSVARTIKGVFDRFERTRRIEFNETEQGEFAIGLPQGAVDKPGKLVPHRLRGLDWKRDELPPEWAAAIQGSRAELVLRSSRFLFRPLGLPKQAKEYLEGIVRAQIDRLTPWSPSDAVYHWTCPREVGERITVVVVATARNMVSPLVQAVSDLGASSVEVSTLAPDADHARITVFNQLNAGASNLRQLRRALLAVFVSTGLAAALSNSASGFVAQHYAEQNQQIQRRIAERRAIIRGGQAGGESSPLGLLERRKHASAASVMVIEALSAVLPDHTYATELRIEGDKVHIVGMTRDAPALIELLEQSPHFARAAFSAPTTRGPNEPGERFHIEARIRPHHKLGT